MTTPFIIYFIYTHRQTEDLPIGGLLTTHTTPQEHTPYIACTLS